MSPLAFALMLSALGNLAVVVLTSPDRTGAEGPLLVVLGATGAILAFGISDRVWYSNTRPRAEGD